MCVLVNPALMCGKHVRYIACVRLLLYMFVQHNYIFVTHTMRVCVCGGDGGVQVYVYACEHVCASVCLWSLVTVTVCGA